MSRAPTGRVTPSCSSTATEIRWARGTPRRWIPTSTSPSVPACFSTSSWEMRMTARRISSAVMIWRPSIRRARDVTRASSFPASPDRSLKGRHKDTAPAGAGRGQRDAGPERRKGGRSASDDELVGPRIRGAVEAPGTILRPRIHAHGAPLPVLAGRAGPGQPVAAKRQARERRDVGQQRVAYAPVRVHREEAEPPGRLVRRTGDPDGQVPARRIPARIPAGDARQPGGPGERYRGDVAGADERLPVGGDEPAIRGDPRAVSYTHLRAH